MTDVSSAEAFKAHDIKIPEGATRLRYQADSQDDGYPLAAVFDLSCSSVPLFIESTGADRVSLQDLIDTGVEVFAQYLGWSTRDGTARWYQRRGNGLIDLYVLVSGSGNECTVYLDSNQ